MPFKCTYIPVCTLREPHFIVHIVLARLHARLQASPHAQLAQQPAARAQAVVERRRLCLVRVLTRARRVRVRARALDVQREAAVRGARARLAVDVQEALQRGQRVVPARAREQEHADAVDVPLDGLLEARREPAREREVEEEAPGVVALVVVLVRELVREHVEQRGRRAQLGAQVDVRARVRELLLPVAHDGVVPGVGRDGDVVERVQRVVHAQVGHAQPVAVHDLERLVGEPDLSSRGVHVRRESCSGHSV